MKISTWHALCLLGVAAVLGACQPGGEPRELLVAGAVYPDSGSAST